MNYSRNPQGLLLLSHSYGQGGTVALPGLKSNPIRGPRKDFPAGVQDVLNRLAYQYIDWTSAGPQVADVEWCFLVGGPGNGKSEALKELAELLEVTLPQRVSGEPAPRTVPRSWPSSAAAIPTVPGIEIVFINDASIPRPDAPGREKRGSLFLDLVDGMNWLVSRDTSIVLFGNINRGILVEEEATLREKSDWQASVAGELAQQVITWLLRPPGESPHDNHGELETIVPINPRRPYYGQFRIPLTKKLGTDYDVLVHVVFLDTLSLLEPLPGGGVNKAIDFSVTPPRVDDYQTFGGFSDERGATRDQTIAGKLLVDLVKAAYWEGEGCVNPKSQVLCEAFDVCPFVQNARWLRVPDLQRKFLDTLRAAEIAASRRFTYRDLWGHLSLAILGELEDEWLRGLHPCEWVKYKKEAIDSESSKKTVAELVNHRVYMNLFPSPAPAAWNREKVPPRLDTLFGIAIDDMTSIKDPAREQAFDRAFNYIDPARDFDSWKGLREKVIDAVESLEIEPPFKQLLNSGVLPDEAHSKIEEVLDQVIQDEISEELTRSTRRSTEPARAPATRARLLRRWRNIVLLRQLGLANGQMAFKDALIAWLAEQDNALRSRNLLELGRGIEALILPASATGRFLLAPFRPRTYSLEEGSLPKNTLLVAIRPDDLSVDIVPRGDALIAEILQTRRGSRKPPEVVASLVIDLAIAREAILQANEGVTSFTEIGRSSFARIERVRASLIGRDKLKQAAMYLTDEQGKLYVVVDSPVEPSRLRILPVEH